MRLAASTIKAVAGTRLATSNTAIIAGVSALAGERSEITSQLAVAITTKVASIASSRSGTRRVRRKATARRRRHLGRALEMIGVSAFTRAGYHKNVAKR